MSFFVDEKTNLLLGPGLRLNRFADHSHFGEATKGWGKPEGALPAEKLYANDLSNAYANAESLGLHNHKTENGQALQPVIPI